MGCVQLDMLIGMVWMERVLTAGGGLLTIADDMTFTIYLGSASVGMFSLGLE